MRSRPLTRQFISGRDQKSIPRGGNAVSELEISILAVLFWAWLPACSPVLPPPEASPSPVPETEPAARVQFSSESIDKATQEVYEHLQYPGLAVEYFEWRLPAGAVTKGRDVVATLPGTSSPDEIILLTAHVDDMVDRDVDPAGVERTKPPIPVSDPLWGRLPAPGADDNASGTAGILLAARILSAYRFQRTVRFAVFTGEEIGYLGSYAYAAATREAGENIVAVIHPDMLASDKKGGPVVDLNMRAPADSPQDTALADVFAEIVRIYRIDLIPERQYESGFYVGSDHGTF
jgi:hypothetical protein